MVNMSAMQVANIQLILFLYCVQFCLYFFCTGIVLQGLFRQKSEDLDEFIWKHIVYEHCLRSLTKLHTVATTGI
jgi:hypothetical protein